MYLWKSRYAFWARSHFPRNFFLIFLVVLSYYTVRNEQKNDMPGKVLYPQQKPRVRISTGELFNFSKFLFLNDSKWRLDETSVLTCWNLAKLKSSMVRRSRRCWKEKNSGSNPDGGPSFSFQNFVFKLRRHFTTSSYLEIFFRIYIWRIAY